MIVELIAASSLAAVVGIAVWKLRSYREIDVRSFILSKIVVKVRLVKLLSMLGLTERMRSDKPVKFVTRNGFAHTAESPMFKAVVDYVWKVEIRDSDVFVATYPKSGTTWMQEIVWLICNNANTEAAKQTVLTRRSVFMDIIDVGDTLGFQSLEKWPSDNQRSESRKFRIVKTHLPFEILPRDITVEKKGKIVYVARNPKDVCVSYYHFHHMVFTCPKTGTWDEFLTKFCNGEVSSGDWFAHNIKYWKEFEKDPNRIYFTTYESLKADLPREVKSIADFLGRDLSAEQIHTIAENCTFESMRNNNSTNHEAMNKAGVFDFSKAKFMRKGQVGDWKNYFTVNQAAEFDDLFEKKMKGTGLGSRFGL